MTKFHDNFIPPNDQLIEDPLTDNCESFQRLNESLVMDTMIDIYPPRPLCGSKTFSLAKGMIAFSRIVATAAFFSEAGILVLLPKEHQAIANTILLVVGVLAMLLGIEDKGKKIVLERLSKPDVFTPLGKPGNNADTAKTAVYLDRAQLQIAKEALNDDITII